MRTNLPFIQQRVTAMLGGIGTSVRITWLEYPAGSTRNPVNGSFSGTPTRQEQIVQAFLHFPDAGGMNSAVRMFNEVELGDCIADFPPDVSLEAQPGPGNAPGEMKLGLTFEFLDPDGEPLVEGETWVPKPTGEKLQRTWDVVVQGRRLFRPVLLRKGRAVPA